MVVALLEKVKVVSRSYKSVRGTGANAGL